MEVQARHEISEKGSVIDRQGGQSDDIDMEYIERIPDSAVPKKKKGSKKAKKKPKPLVLPQPGDDPDSSIPALTLLSPASASVTTPTSKSPTSPSFKSLKVSQIHLLYN